MKGCWDEQELIEHWTLFASKQPLLDNRTDRGRIGMAVLLKLGSDNHWYGYGKPCITVPMIVSPGQKLKARVEAYAGPAQPSADPAGSGERLATA